MGFDKVYMCCCREVQAAEVSREYSYRLAVCSYPTDPLPVESSITLRPGSDWNLNMASFLCSSDILPSIRTYVID